VEKGVVAQPSPEHGKTGEEMDLSKEKGKRRENLVNKEMGGL